MAGITGSNGGWVRDRSKRVVNVHSGDLILIQGGSPFIVQDDTLVPVQILKVDPALKTVYIKEKLCVDGIIESTQNIEAQKSVKAESLDHSCLNSPIPISEVGDPALLSKFESVSIVGALNELMSLIQNIKSHELWNFLPAPQSPSNGQEQWFSSVFPYEVGRVLVFVNGMLQYVPTYLQNFSGTGITFTDSVPEDSDVVLFYSDKTMVSQWVFENSTTPVTDSSVLSYGTTEEFSSGKMALFIGNVFQHPDFYTEDPDNKRILLKESPPDGLSVRFFYFKKGYGTEWGFESPVEGKGDGVRKIFSTSLPFKDGKTLVFVGGLLQDIYDTQGTLSQVVFSEAPYNESNIFIVYLIN